MLIAQITDLHIGLPGSSMFDDFKSHQALERAVAHINSLSPLVDFVIATGDLVDTGNPREYERLRETLNKLNPKYYVLPGNHDSREDLRDTFAGDGYLPESGFLQYSEVLGGIRLVALDTLVPGHSRGLLCSERLQWLDKTLAAKPVQPTLIAMHHPPFATGMRGSDNMGLEGRDAFEELVGTHLQVEHVISGHVHRSITRRLGHCVASTMASTTSQLALDLTGSPAIAIRAEPPCVGLHFIDESVGWVNHLSYINDYGEPLVVA